MFDILLSLIVIFLLIPFLILSVVTIWVYRDAKKRDMNFFAWILIIWLIPFLIGLIVYVFIRERYSNRND